MSNPYRRIFNPIYDLTHVRVADPTIGFGVANSEERTNLDEGVMEYKENNPNLQPILEQLEVARKKVANKYILGYSFICLGIILALIFFSLQLFGIAVTLFFFCPFLGFIILLFVDDKENRYKLDFKQRVIASIVESGDSNLQIDPNSGIGPRDFVDSFCFPRSPIFTRLKI